MMESETWVLETSAGGDERQFAVEELPVLIGGSAECDVRLNEVSGSFQIDVLDGAFFVQPGKDTRGLRLDGDPIAGSRWLKDGETLSLDTARARCSLGDGRLSLLIEGQVTGGDTVPPAPLVEEADLESADESVINLKKTENSTTDRPKSDPF